MEAIRGIGRILYRKKYAYTDSDSCYELTLHMGDFVRIVEVESTAADWLHNGALIALDVRRTYSHDCMGRGLPYLKGENLTALPDESEEMAVALLGLEPLPHDLEENACQKEWENVSQAQTVPVDGVVILHDNRKILCAKDMVVDKGQIVAYVYESNGQRHAVQASMGGRIVYMVIRDGEEVSAGDRICFIAAPKEMDDPELY